MLVANQNKHSYIYLITFCFTLNNAWLLECLSRIVHRPLSSLFYSSSVQFEACLVSRAAFGYVYLHASVSFYTTMNLLIKTLQGRVDFMFCTTICLTVRLCFLTGVFDRQRVICCFKL